MKIKFIGNERARRIRYSCFDYCVLSREHFDRSSEILSPQEPVQQFFILVPSESMMYCLSDNYAWSFHINVNIFNV
jgi:hypothetical protein